MEENRTVFNQLLLGFISTWLNLAPSMCMGFSAILSNVFTHNEYPWFASITLIGMIIGYFISGPILDKFGRRKTLILMNVIVLIGWLQIRFGEQLYSFRFNLYCGRLLTGLSMGSGSTATIVYTTEIANKKMRPIMTTLTSLSVSFGILLVYVLGFVFKKDWHKITSTILLFPIIGLITSIVYLPETKSWIESKTQEKHELLPKLFLKSTTWKPFVIITIYFAFQQLSGVYFVIFYALDFANSLECKLDSYWIIIGVAVTRVVSGILISYISKNFGRRTISVFSGISMTASLILLGIYTILLDQDRNYWNFLSNTATILLLFYIFCCTVGFLTIPFAMCAELFSTELRGKFSGIIIGITFSLCFILIKIYPILLSCLKMYGIFFFCGTMSLIGTVFVIFFLPETKGKTLREIQQHFEQ